MEPRDEEPGDGEQADHRVTDERQVEVAGAGAIDVERRAILPAPAGDCAATNDDGCALRDLLTDDLDQLLEALLIPAEDEPDDVRALLRIRKSVFDLTVLPVGHASPIGCRTHARGAWTRVMDTPQLSLRTAPVAQPMLLILLLFGSGFSALVYQILWLRLLALVFGVTVHAASTVLAAFMAGLAVGSVVSGRLADRVAAPARWFGGVELLIGVTALATPA